MTIDPLFSILLIEDEEILRRITARFLARPDRTIVSAANGKEALAILKERNFDLIVSDISMPEMSGLELLQRLTNESYSRPFIFLTAYEGSSWETSAATLGAYALLAKPYRKAQHDEIITAALASSNQKR